MGSDKINIQQEFEAGLQDFEMVVSGFKIDNFNELENIFFNRKTA